MPMSLPVARRLSSGLVPKRLHPVETALRKMALAYPEAREDFPWGATFGAKEKPPLDMLAAWLDESYRAVASCSVLSSATPPAASRPPPAPPVSN
jgi:hypothetical protein